MINGQESSAGRANAGEQLNRTMLVFVMNCEEGKGDYVVSVVSLLMRTAQFSDAQPKVTETTHKNAAVLFHVIERLSHRES